MKKLFIQFYLLLFVCFLVMSLLVGLVYKFTAIILTTLVTTYLFYSTVVVT